MKPTREQILEASNEQLNAWVAIWIVQRQKLCKLPFVVPRC